MPQVDTLVHTCHNASMSSYDMRATLIVKAVKDGRIVQLFDVSSIDEATVRAAVVRLETAYKGEARVDTSQVEIARRAMAA